MNIEFSLLRSGSNDVHKSKRLRCLDGCGRYSSFHSRQTRARLSRLRQLHCNTGNCHVNGPCKGEYKKYDNLLMRKRELVHNDFTFQMETKRLSAPFGDCTSDKTSVPSYYYPGEYMIEVNMLSCVQMLSELEELYLSITS